jgi:hypothetical protein
MFRSLTLAASILAGAITLSADTFSITVTLASLDETTIPSGTYQGSFTTNGTCTVCTVANGGITSFQVPIQTGSSVTDPAVLVFNALDAANNFSTQPQYTAASQSLASATNPTILMVENINAGTKPNVGYPELVLLELTPTTVNTPPTSCDANDTVRRGCASLRPVEGTFATGTYTVQPQTSPGPSCTATTANNSNFNGTNINPGSFIWFNSNLQAFGVNNKKVQIFFQHQTIQFVSDKAYTVPVNDAVITLDPTATCASTSFDTSTQTWRTTVPGSGGDEVFLSGVAFPVPTGFAKVNGNVTWQGTMGTDTPSVTTSWKWGAAVYSSFTTDYNAVAPKAAHQNACAMNNGDHAGTPEGSLNGVSLKKYVVGGARGGGGSNFTGSWSGTANVVPVCQP